MCVQEVSEYVQEVCGYVQEVSGYVQEVEALQGWGEKCWRLKEAGPGRNTGLPAMLVAKLVSTAEGAELALPEGSKGCTAEPHGEKSPSRTVRPAHSPPAPPTEILPTPSHLHTKLKLMFPLTSPSTVSIQTVLLRQMFIFLRS